MRHKINSHDHLPSSPQSSDKKEKIETSEIKPLSN